MNTSEKESVNEVVEMFSKLPADDQKAILIIGKNMLFINDVKNEAK